MCERVMAVVAGNPVTSTRKFTVPDVIAPAASFTRLKSMVAVPLPAASGPVTILGATSLAGRRGALNWTWLSSAAGVVGLSLLQLAARTAIATVSTGMIEKRFMGTLLLVGWSLEKFPGEVESHIQRVRVSALRRLAECR